MKHMLKLLSLVIAFAMILSAPMASFARSGDFNTKDRPANTKMADRLDEDDEDEDEDEDEEEGLNLEEVLSRDEVLRIVRSLTDGKIVKMELDEDDDRYIYEIEAESDTAEYELEIDATTGEVLEMDVDEKEVDDEDTLLPDAISEDEAMRIALEAVKGTILEVEADDLDEKDGRYEVKMLLDGVEYEIKINAFTGEIMEIDQEDMDMDDEEEDEKEDEKDAPAWGHIKNDLQNQRKLLKERMKSTREQMEDFEDSIEDAMEMGDLESVESFQKMIQDFQVELNVQKLMSKEMIREMQQLMRNKYSETEWETLEKNKEEIKGIPGIRVMPAESILMPEGNLKFDVPPVIKNSRMLVPIRAISEALDAEVSWDNDIRTATIVTDEHTIVIAVSDETILVNGEPVETDVPAEIVN